MSQSTANPTSVVYNGSHSYLPDREQSGAPLADVAPSHCLAQHASYAGTTLQLPVFSLRIFRLHFRIRDRPVEKELYRGMRFFAELTVSPVLALPVNWSITGGIIRCLLHNGETESEATWPLTKVTLRERPHNEARIPNPVVAPPLWGAEVRVDRKELGKLKRWARAPTMNSAIFDGSVYISTSNQGIITVPIVPTMRFKVLARQPDAGAPPDAPNTRPQRAKKFTSSPKPKTARRPSTEMRARTVAMAPSATYSEADASAPPCKRPTEANAVTVSALTARAVGSRDAGRPANGRGSADVVSSMPLPSPLATAAPTVAPRSAPPAAAPSAAPPADTAPPTSEVFSLGHFLASINQPAAPATAAPPLVPPVPQAAFSGDLSLFGALTCSFGEAAAEDVVMSSECKGATEATARPICLSSSFGAMPIPMRRVRTSRAFSALSVNSDTSVNKSPAGGPPNIGIVSALSNNSFNSLFAGPTMGGTQSHPHLPRFDSAVGSSSSLPTGGEMPSHWW